MEHARAGEAAPHKDKDKPQPPAITYAYIGHIGAPGVGAVQQPRARSCST